MRHIHHPGTPAAQRNTAVDASVQSCQLQLQPGRSLLTALTEALAPGGASPRGRGAGGWGSPPQAPPFQSQ